jgi:hypothetical protein
MVLLQVWLFPEYGSLPSMSTIGILSRRASIIGMPFRGVHFISVHLIGVYLTGVHVTCLDLAVPARFRFRHTSACSRPGGAVDAGSCQARSCLGEETHASAALGARSGPGTSASIKLLSLTGEGSG